MENLPSEQNENVDMSQSITSIPDKESIEDKYNKLRGFAVKLKKKVTDLTEQVQNLESEKLKITTEKDELYNNFIQITVSAKKVQTIQLEYDKIQDKMEQCKVENKKLLKNIESLINQNTSLNESLLHEKNTVSSLSSKIDHLIIEKKDWNLLNKQFVDERKKLKNELKAHLVIKEQFDKKYETLKSNLETEIGAHKNIKNQLDALKQEHTSSNVLSLEVENYEKSIKEMKLICAEETSKREAAEKSIEKHLEQIISLNTQISELQNTNMERKKEIINLQEKYDTEQSNHQKLLDKINNMQKKTNDLIQQLKLLESEKKNLLRQLDEQFNEKNKFLNEKRFDKENSDKIIKDLTLEVAQLNESLKQSKDDAETLRQEFDSYKLRAQSVLRTKECNKITGNKGKSIIEFEEELEHAQFQNDLLKEKVENYSQKMESLNSDLTVMKDEKDHALENRKELNDKLCNLRQEYKLLIEQNNSQDIKNQQIHAEYKKEIEQLHNQCKSEINEQKEHHRNEILTLKSEYEKITFYNSSKNESLESKKLTESNSDSNVFSRIPAPLIEREECEGSESVDSCSQGGINAERYRRHSLMPLDELLNSSDDQDTYERKISPTKPSKQEFDVCQHRIKHLTVLLGDAERDIAKLTQQNELLKEDMRRQQRSAEREQHANNFEYLKNVVFKFVTLKNGDERNHLIPVLTTILKLSPEEIHKINAVAGVRSWIPGISGWH